VISLFFKKRFIILRYRTNYNYRTTSSIIKNILK